MIESQEGHMRNRPSRGFCARINSRASTPKMRSTVALVALFSGCGFIGFEGVPGSDASTEVVAVPDVTTMDSGHAMAAQDAAPDPVMDATIADSGSTVDATPDA